MIFDNMSMNEQQPQNLEEDTRDIGRNMLQELMQQSAAMKMDDEEDLENYTLDLFGRASPYSASCSTNMYSCSIMSPLPDKSRFNEQHVYIDELEQ